ncbi:oxidoreductase [Alicyclobacillus contaminans]|uniref:SDR family oxidoreductase n=1 Tax=Alicyclobacillus contaminans TaxID=392016 RepID=UPI00041983F1|nr:SDR family oxidoreductase [Alicyclobacillus contaminans]GMA48864.1 oxidoreductase [Alicyclobacillus contaminans]
MDFGLAGKTVLVTASSRGLGFATALRFAQEGARVMLASRNAEHLAAAAERIQREVPKADVAWCAADVSKAEEIDRLYAQVKQRFSGVDVLVTNGGGPPPGGFDAVADEAWQAAFELSLLSVVRLVRGALPHMRAQRWGRIVHIASSSIKQPIDNLVLSNTFRTAVAGLSKSLALELAPDNILVNTLGPGRIATNRVAELDANTATREGISVAAVVARSVAQIPLGRYGEPDEFAALAVFLGSAANGYITGQSILVDGGMVRSL